MRAIITAVLIFFVSSAISAGDKLLICDTKPVFENGVPNRNCDFTQRLSILIPDGSMNLEGWVKVKTLSSLCLIGTEYSLPTFSEEMRVQTDTLDFRNNMGIPYLSVERAFLKGVATRPTETGEKGYTFYQCRVEAAPLNL